jgi:hypothetical protein
LRATLEKLEELRAAGDRQEPARKKQEKFLLMQLSIGVSTAAANALAPLRLSGGFI